MFVGRRGLLAGERASCEARWAHPCRELHWSDVSIPADLDPLPVACRWWLSPAPSLDAFTFQVGFIEALERRGCRIVNSPRAVLACDKLSVATTCQRALAGDGGPVKFPPTLVTTGVAAARAFAATHGRVVSKPLSGQGGHELEFLDGNAPGIQDQLERVLATRDVLLLQAAIPDVRFEIRTIIVDGTIVNIHARLPSQGIANVSRGGTIVPLHDPRVGLPAASIEAIQAVAVRVAAITGLDLLAVDCMVDESGTPWLVEWNPFFGYTGTAFVQPAVEGAIVDFIHRKVVDAW